MEDLFEENIKKAAPLAEKMRPKDLSEFVGQEHLIYENSFMSRAIKADSLGSCIFFGPPGTGKTTLANIIANTCKGIFKKLNAVSSGVADAKAVIQEAKNNLKLYGTRTFLLLDECHRWSKAQSDCVLQAIEDGSITFIGSTTENPYISMTRAIVSRCRVFEFRPLSTDDIEKALKRALKDKKNGYGNIKTRIREGALRHLAWASIGDLRNAYNALELAVKTTPLDKKGELILTKEVAEQCIQKKIAPLGENELYDVLSAFCKSLRGSDTEAALFYFARLIKAGCDPLIIARRLMAHSSEDVGLADSNALLLCNAALNSVEKLGLPECLLSLTHAIIYLCEAEKSNSVYIALHKAINDAEKYADAQVPNNLKNHPAGYDDGTSKYKYPHDFGGYCKQQYLPEVVKNARYYIPKNNGREKGLQRKKDLYNKD